MPRHVLNLGATTSQHHLTYSIIFTFLFSTFHFNPNSEDKKNKMQIKQRTFIITGGASGLGLATSIDLYSQGGHIAILDLNPESGAAAIQQLLSSSSSSSSSDDKSNSPRAKFFPVDVTDTSSLQSAIDSAATWAQSQHAPLGGLIPAAGVGNPAKLLDKNLNPIPMDTIDFVIDVNLRGVLNTIRLTLPHLARNEPWGPDGERGVIVMVSSSSAFEGQIGQLSYAATKGAIRSMTLVLARDLAGNGIRAVSVAPSLFETNMSKMLPEKVQLALRRQAEWPKRLGRAEEFAGFVRCVIENGYMNGECYRLDAATRMTARM